MPSRRFKYFIAGTDTDCGKTLAACALLHAANTAGMSTVGMKPLAAGGIETPDGLRNDDALQLQAASSIELPYEQVNPVCLADPVSPHIAAANAGKRIRAESLAGYCQGLLLKRADFSVIEGAGGWRVPINDQEFMSTLARQLQLPVILVVGMKLGCINHALLTAETIIRDGLSIAGWIANSRDPNMLARAENLATLQEAIPFPMLGDIPWLEQPDAQAASVHLRLQELVG